MPGLKLTELNAEIKGGVLVFDCPQHRGEHRIRVPLKGLAPANQHGCAWSHTGGLPDTLTLHPSVNVEGCWHGEVVNGMVILK